MRIGAQRVGPANVGGGEEATLTGLSWDGNPGTGPWIRRRILFLNPPPIYDMTYLLKSFPRAQPTGSDNRYWTFFFWSNNGSNAWDGGAQESYYGMHPYPDPAPLGTPKWEISVNSGDFVERNNGTEPNVVFDQWYSQAFVADRASASVTNHKAYLNLPDVTDEWIIEHQVDNAGWADEEPPEPCISFGQAPPLDGDPDVSFGGYERWEECNAILRGVQIYTEALSESQILTLSACETDAEVLAACSTLGITSLWYLNMNWTVDDISDKSGNGHHPAWDGSGRPDLWTSS